MQNGMLEFKDAPMFGRVMRDEAICRDVIECILGIEVERIDYLSPEHTLDPAADAKGVRLDVFARSPERVFDIEIQTTTDSALGKRMRYYQASMDTAVLDKGDDHVLLPESYIIFICTFDPYGAGLPAYHLERTCEEDESVQAADASHWLVLNASAWEQDADERRSTLLQYVAKGTAAQDGLTRRLEDAVHSINADAAWREQAMGFMTVEQNTKARVRTAREEGLQQGEARYALLVDKLIEQGRLDDLKRTAEDAAFRAALLREIVS